MSTLATLQPDPAPVVACTISRDVMNFEQLIEDMETELGESWGDLSIEDAPRFLSQPDADGLKYVVMALDAQDEAGLAPILALIRLTVERGIKLIMVTADLNATMLNQLLRAGAEHFVHYPLIRGALKEVIAHLETLPKPSPAPISRPQKRKAAAQAAAARTGSPLPEPAPKQPAPAPATTGGSSAGSTPDPLLLDAALQVKAAASQSPAQKKPQSTASLGQGPAPSAAVTSGTVPLGAVTSGIVTAGMVSSAPAASGPATKGMVSSAVLDIDAPDADAMRHAGVPQAQPQSQYQPQPSQSPRQQASYGQTGYGQTGYGQMGSNQTGSDHMGYARSGNGPEGLAQADHIQAGAESTRLGLDHGNATTPPPSNRKRQSDHDLIRMRHALREAAAEVAQHHHQGAYQPNGQSHGQSHGQPYAQSNGQSLRPSVAGRPAPSAHLQPRDQMQPQGASAKPPPPPRFVEPGLADPAPRPETRYANRPPAHGAGFVIPVHGLSGGAGSTTLAVNLAWELAHLRPGAAAPRVCLMDFDFQYGSVATYLDQPRSEEVYDVLTQTLRNPPERFFASLTRVSESLHILSAPVDMLPLDIIGAAEATRLIDYAAAQYDYVIIDLPKAIVAWTEAVITRADLYFIMMELDLRSAQNVLRLLRALKAEALPYQKLRYLLNRSPKMTDLGSKNRIRRLAESLDITIDVELPDGGAAVTQANDQGQPLAEAAAENPLRSEILRLATSLDSNHHPRRFRGAGL